MSISLVGSNEANANSIAIPAHQVNDLILIYAYNDAQTTAVTLPAGFVNVSGVVMGSFGYTRVGYKIATSTSETSGTWTNADHLIVLVFRGGTDTVVMPEFLSTTSATSTSVTYTAQPTGTFRDGASDVAMVGLVAQRNAANNLAQAPGAMTNILDGGDGANYQVAAHWDDARTTAWASTSITVATSALYRTHVIGLFEQAFTQTAVGGGLLLPRGFQGGL